MSQAEKILGKLTDGSLVSILIAVFLLAQLFATVVDDVRRLEQSIKDNTLANQALLELHLEWYAVTQERNNNGTRTTD